MAPFIPVPPGTGPINLPPPSPPQNKGGQPMTLPSSGWWDAPFIDNWGFYPDPQGAFPKPDINIILPANYPLVAPLPGVVSGINFAPGSSGNPDNPNYAPAFGAVITVKMTKPINDVAQYYSFLHLARIQPGLRVGSSIMPGDILGYGGAGQTLGAASASVGFALYAGSHYGFGSEWTQYIQRPSHTIDPRLDPHPLINSLKNGSIGIDFANNFDTASGGLFNFSISGGVGSNSGIVNKAKVVFSPNESVAVFLGGIDDTLTLINPAPSSDSVDQINIAGANIPNPISWMSDFFYNLVVVDGGAIIVRSLLIIIGTLICYKVISTAVGLSITRGASKDVGIL